MNIELKKANNALVFDFALPNYEQITRELVTVREGSLFMGQLESDNLVSSPWANACGHATAQKALIQRYFGSMGTVLWRRMAALYDYTE